MDLHSPFVKKPVAQSGRPSIQLLFIVLFLLAIVAVVFVMVTKGGGGDSQFDKSQQRNSKVEMDSIQVESQTIVCLLNWIDPDRYPISSLDSHPSRRFCFEVAGFYLAEKPPAVPTEVSPPSGDLPPVPPPTIDGNCKSVGTCMGSKPPE